MKVYSSNMAVVILSLFSLSTLMVSGMETPKNYILDVTSDCGKSGSSKPLVNILSDLDVRAVGKCANGDMKFSKIDAAHYSLTGSYSHLVKGCLFHNFRGTQQLEVVVMYGKPGNGVQIQEQIYTISCSFNAKSTIKGKSLKLNKGMVRPKETLYTVASSLPSSSFRIALQDVRGKSVTGSLPIDKVVSLKVAITKYLGSPRYMGLKPVSCSGVGSNKERFTFLRAGCGDGVIIPKDIGFMTKGLSATSPYFKTFFVEGNKLVSFECTFSICTTKCDGSSCTIGSNINK